nr:hypothetical protein [Tanacetum cinerariifolium]
MDIPSFMIQYSVCHAIWIMIGYHLVMEVPQDYNVSSAVPCLFIRSIYVIPCLYIRSLSVMLSRIFFSCLIRQTLFSLRSFKTLCLLNYALMKRHDYDITCEYDNSNVVRKKVINGYVVENVLMRCGGAFVRNAGNKKYNKYKESTLFKGM